MKKTGVIILAIISLLCLTACFGTSKTKEYVLTNTPIDAQELVDMYKDSGECEDIYTDDKKGVVMLLTEKQKKELLHSVSIENLESSNFPLLNIGPSFSLQNHCSELTIEGTKEEILAFEEGAKNYAFAAEVQQVLNGEEDWHLKVTLINSETDTLWHTFNLPEETLDWTVLKEE